jgi:glutamine synthetase
MPKPLEDEAGNGMHCNMSLFKDGKNAFNDPNGENGLSQEAYYFMGGLMNHAKGMCAITNPLVNSYKRLVPGYEAPVYITWSLANRSPLVRIPVSRGKGTRLELRHPDPTCNPYLALAAMLVCGLEGIQNKIQPPPPVNRNIYKMTEQDLDEAGIERLPSSLQRALTALMQDEVIKNTLGVHVLENFYKAKTIEWNNYSSAVHRWEIDRYLKIY